MTVEKTTPSRATRSAPPPATSPAAASTEGPEGLLPKLQALKEQVPTFGRSRAAVPGLALADPFAHALFNRCQRSVTRSRAGMRSSKRSLKSEPTSLFSPALLKRCLAL